MLAVSLPPSLPLSSSGCTDDIEFFHGHGQFSEELYREIKSTCPDEMLKGPNLSPACLKLIDQMSDEVGGFYAYNLYNMCPVGAGGKYGMNRALGSRAAVYSEVLGKGPGAAMAAAATFLCQRP